MNIYGCGACNRVQRNRGVRAAVAYRPIWGQRKAGAAAPGVLARTYEATASSRKWVASTALLEGARSAGRLAQGMTAPPTRDAAEDTGRPRHTRHLLAKRSQIPQCLQCTGKRPGNPWPGRTSRRSSGYGWSELVTGCKERAG